MTLATLGQIKEQLKRTAEELVELRLQLRRQAEEADTKLVAAMAAGAARHHDVERLREKLSQAEAALDAEAAEHRYQACYF
jgi:hypothetical protein